MHFAVTVDTYNSDDWQKLKAAINVLKNPVLDDSVLLEPSAIGQYLHTNYIRSQSSPSIDNMTDEELQMLHGGSLSPTAIDYKAPEAFDEGQGRYGSNGHTRRASEGLLSAYRVRVSDSSEGYNGSPYTTNVEGEENMVNNWVAGLPEYGRRSRSHTEPLVPLARLSTATKSESIESFDNCKVKTLPNYLSPVPAQQEGGVDAQGKGTSVPQLRVAAAETRLSPPRYSSPSKRSSVQSTSPPSSGLDFRPNSIPSPTSPVNSRSKLVKVYMSKVQKGMIYSSSYFAAEVRNGWYSSSLLLFPPPLPPHYHVSPPPPISPPLPPSSLPCISSTIPYSTCMPSCFHLQVVSTSPLWQTSPLQWRMS